MAGVTRNPSQRLAYSVPGSVLGSRTEVGQLIAPRKGNSAAQEFAILFDDVGHGSADPYSGIGCTSDGSIVISPRGNQTVFKANGDVCKTGDQVICSDTGAVRIDAATNINLEAGPNIYRFNETNPQIAVSGVEWFGGNLPPFGSDITNPLVSNAVNCTGIPYGRAFWIKTGSITQFNFCNTITVSGAGVFSIELEFDEMNTLRGTNFDASVGACGHGSTNGIPVHVDSVNGSKRVLISSTAAAAGGFTANLHFSFMLLTS